METRVGTGIIEEDEPSPSQTTSPLGMLDATDNLVFARGLLKTKSLTIFTRPDKRGLPIPVMEVPEEDFPPLKFPYDTPNPFYARGDIKGGIKSDF